MSPAHLGSIIISSKKFGHLSTEALYCLMYPCDHILNHQKTGVLTFPLI